MQGCREVENIGKGEEWRVDLDLDPGPEIFLPPGPGPKISDMMKFS